MSNFFYLLLILFYVLIGIGTGLFAFQVLMSETEMKMKTIQIITIWIFAFWPLAICLFFGIKFGVYLLQTFYYKFKEAEEESHKQEDNSNE